MYSVPDHGTMIADRVRVGAYVQALERTVQPGAVVVEIGTGSGLFAVLAAKLGARKVYAIEPDEVIELAKEIARDNGCDHKIEFIRDVSMNVELRERADLIISDLHGGLPFFADGLASLIDARRRFLAPGGTMVPLRERIWIAAAELSDEEYGRVAVWKDGRWGVNLSAGARFGADHLFSARLQPAKLLTRPACIATLEHLSLESASVNAREWLTVVGDGPCHGYSLWFDSDLTEGVSLTASPGAPETVYPNPFAPWPEAVEVRSGDRIEADLRFALVNREYVTGWNTRVQAAGGEIKAEFRQSTLNSEFVTVDRLRKRAPGYCPALTAAGLGERILLQLMDGTRSLEEVARLARKQCPEAFRDEQTALRAAAELSERLTK